MYLLLHTSFPFKFLSHRNICFNIFLEDKDVKQSSTTPIKYQVTFKAKNYANVPLTLRWRFGGKSYTLDVDRGAKLRQTIAFSSLTKPSPIVFNVYKKGTQELGTINGQQSLEAQPLEKALVSLWKLNFGKF